MLLGCSIKAILADSLFVGEKEEETKERMKKVIDKGLIFEKKETDFCGFDEFFKNTYKTVRFGIETVIFSFIKTEDGRGMLTDERCRYGCYGEMVAC